MSTKEKFAKEFFLLYFRRKKSFFSWNKIRNCQNSNCKFCMLFKQMFSRNKNSTTADNNLAAHITKARKKKKLRVFCHSLATLFLNKRVGLSPPLYAIILVLWNHLGVFQFSHSQNSIMRIFYHDAKFFVKMNTSKRQFVYVPLSTTFFSSNRHQHFYGDYFRCFFF